MIRSRSVSRRSKDWEITSTVCLQGGSFLNNQNLIACFSFSYQPGFILVPAHVPLEPIQLKTVSQVESRAMQHYPKVIHRDAQTFTNFFAV